MTEHQTIGSNGNFTYADLFAGCGGLSLGLQRAGGKHIMAVEKSAMASESYFMNLISRDNSAWTRHLQEDATAQGRAGLVVNVLETVLNDAATMKRLAEQKLDLVAGGPPCQGFSLAGRRNSNDPRNKLAWQFLEFVHATNPKFVIIENVVGMHRKFRSEGAQTPFESLRKALSVQGTEGYRVQGVLLNAKHYGAPQSRPRMMLIGVRTDVSKALEIDPSDSILESNFSDLADFLPKSLLPDSQISSADVRIVAHALMDLDPAITDKDKKGVGTQYLEEAAAAQMWGLNSTGERPANHVLRRHRESTQQLFRLLKFLKEKRLLNAARRARIADFTEEAARPLNSLIDALDPSTFPFESGESTIHNKEELIAHIRLFLTRKHSQTVLDWLEPSRTVVTIPDDYIHPLLPRTFSVRELARLQGFPDAFEFYGKVTTGGDSRRLDVPQYTQVGNAVSPHVGFALGSMIASYIDATRDR